MHESLQEFEIWHDSVTDCGVSCPLASEKIPIDLKWENGVATFSQLFLIGSFSYLQVTMTCIRAWMSSKFGQIRPWTTELPALERLKIDVAPFSVVFHPILSILIGNDDMHKSSKEFKIRPDPTTDCRLSCP